MIKRFAKYYKPHLGLFSFDMICAFLVAMADLLYPIIARNIINDYVPNKNVHLFLTSILILLAIYLTKAILNYCIQYWGHIVGVRIQGDMRAEMFAHLQKLPFSFYDEHKTGAIMSRLMNDLFEVSELAHHGPENLFLSLIMLSGAFVILGSIDIYLTLILFIILPFMVLYAVKTKGLMNDAFRKSREKTADINASVETAIAGIRISRSYTAQEHEAAKFNMANDNLKTARAGTYKAMGIFSSGMTLFMDILYLVVLSMGGLFFLKGRIDAGEFAAYLLYVAQFLKPIDRLVSFFEQLQEGMTGFVRFCEIMDTPAEEEPEDALAPQHLEGEIHFDHVSFSYDNKEHVIDDLTLTIPKGKTLALVGPSGSGKTTLCHLIPRFYDCDKGRITVDGIDITRMTRHSLRKNIGLVSQDVFLFSGTIRENIAYGRLDASLDEIIDAAKKANIHDYIMTLEKGYDTEVGERGIKLSGGQKQRISIARIFLKNPPILILDEATSALDNVTEHLIQQSLEELGQGRTSVVVAHRLTTIQNADEIIVLTSEGIRERGTHSQLLALNGEYASLYNGLTKEENMKNS